MMGHINTHEIVFVGDFGAVTRKTFDQMRSSMGPNPITQCHFTCIIWILVWVLSSCLIMIVLLLPFQSNFFAVWSALNQYVPFSTQKGHYRSALERYSLGYFMNSELHFQVLRLKDRPFYSVVDEHSINTDGDHYTGQQFAFLIKKNETIEM